MGSLPQNATKHQAPYLYEVRGFFVQGWTMGFYPLPSTRLRGVPTGKCPFGSGSGRSLSRAQPTPTCGCRGFESRHANAQQKAPYLSRYGAYLLFKGGRWDSPSGAAAEPLLSQRYPQGSVPVAQPGGLPPAILPHDNLRLSWLRIPPR